MRSEEILDSITSYLEEVLEQLDEPTYDVTYAVNTNLIITT
jgi:hypothetical protein